MAKNRKIMTIKEHLFIRSPLVFNVFNGSIHVDNTSEE